MLEPMQNCFKFYHPDGVSSAHEYVDQNENLENTDKKTEPKSIIAQQDLALNPAENNKNS